MKPLTEQLKKLEGIPVPDFGPLDDWAANRNAEMQRRARRAAGKALPLHLRTACVIHGSSWVASGRAVWSLYGQICYCMVKYVTVWPG